MELIAALLGGLWNRPRLVVPPLLGIAAGLAADGIGKLLNESGAIVADGSEDNGNIRLGHGAILCCGRGRGGFYSQGGMA